MPFSDDNETITYHHPTWDSESYMLFKATRDQTDKDKASKLSSVTAVDYDEDAALQARANGQKYKPAVEIQSPMSTRTALIYTQLKDWFGPEFIIPHHRKDEYGNPHHLAGRKAPVTPYWVGKRDPGELEDIDLWLNLQYKAMTEDQAEQFRKGRRDAARSEDGQSREDQSGAGERDPRLLSPAGPALATE